MGINSITQKIDNKPINKPGKNGNMIEIKKSKTLGTNSRDWTKVTKEDLLKDINQHISDVRKGMDFFMGLIYDAASCHDKTKISHIDIFHEEYKTRFKKTDWWELHQRSERHHLKGENMSKMMLI